MLQICQRNGEFESITADFAAKPTLPLLWKVNRNILKSDKKTTRCHMQSSIIPFLLFVAHAGMPSFRADVSRKHFIVGRRVCQAAYRETEKWC